ncbi:MAG: ribose-phosphate pyrophosphokinase [Aureispira sp.]|nr:ribose-phosphate pyrophosphokinase [Aureispira sp.]
MPGPAYVELTARIRDSSDLMELVLVKNAFDSWLVHRDIQYILHIPYLPYARQDRVCNRGEAHSLKVIAQLINNMNFDAVYLTDPHSIVAETLIDNCVVKPQQTIMDSADWLWNNLHRGRLKFVIVAPDAGAEKKAQAVAQHFGCDMIRATKRRDVATGKILEIGFIDPIPENRSFLIVDDICDGGGTFIPLAGELAKHNAKSVELYVTHGIFSKGTQILLDCFDTIHTTDSFYEGESTDNIKVIHI